MRYATGQGNLDEQDTKDSRSSALFEFNVSQSDLDLLKSSKKQGPTRKFGDDSLQSRHFVLFLFFIGVILIRSVANTGLSLLMWSHDRTSRPGLLS